MVDDETFDDFYAKLRWHLGIAFLALRILSFFFFLDTRLILFLVHEQ